MEFRIADTFTDSLARLTGDEQKAVKTTAFDLQLNPESPGMSFHKLDRAKDKNFWSVRVNDDIRIIVHRTANSLLLTYVNHHDKAYQWAERRKLETHPKTGAAQLIEIRETMVVRDVAVPVFSYGAASSALQSTLPFGETPEAELLGYGVPAEWIGAVRGATEDTLLDLADHLPAEAAEALLELATGGTPRPAHRAPPDSDPFAHPDAQRRFRLIDDALELERALDFPWDKWTVFLHPEQRQIVERDYSGPARVSGSAGTGKTIVALHRAVHLARKDPDVRVLLATFSAPLARALHTKLKRLIGSEPRLGDRIDVQAIDAFGLRLFKSYHGQCELAAEATVREVLEDAYRTEGPSKFSLAFVLAEWEHIVDAHQLASWPDYRDVGRLGRKTRLPEAQRKELWKVFERAGATLQARGLLTRAQMFAKLAESVSAAKNRPFDHMVVDEAQDFTVAQMKFLSALGRDNANGLFFAGDIGQRIFQQPFSWSSLGIDVRGRARHLRINYRTSHQIRMQADRLLGAELADVDGNKEVRSDTISVFNGPPPDVRVFPSENGEIKAVGGWLAKLSAQGVLPHEMGVFVRTRAEWTRAQAAVEAANLSFRILDDQVDSPSGKVLIGTMHLAKGLEFRAVAVMACDDEVIPLQERIESVGDEADLEEVYDTERHLLYVACTRARDHLLVSGVAPGSEFLDDLGA